MAQPIVIIDARMVDPIPHGISRYVTAIASGLAKLAQTTDLGYEPVFIQNLSIDSSFHGFRSVRAGTRFLDPFELYELPGIIKKSGAALYHSPSFSSLFTRGPLRCPCPWVVTLHDLNHLTYGSKPKRIYYQKLVRPFALNAKQIVTVSEFSRGEIAAWLNRQPQSPQSIEIAYNAIDPKSLAPENSSSSSSGGSLLEQHELSSGKYFFCLSNSKPHKNLKLLLGAYMEYRMDEESPWPLVISAGGFDPAEGVLQLGGLRDEEARVLRACAGALVFPSLYEGFGLPPVEAAMAGIPVIASRIPPHQEGLSDLSREEIAWIDPADESTLVAALQRAARGEILPSRETVRQTLAKRFSEERLAKKMHEIYSRALSVV